MIENTNDVIWLAGLLEGEGTFDLHRGRYPRVRLAMTDRDVVGRAAQLFDSTIRVTVRPKPYKASFHAEISGEKAAAIMRQVLPHMGARRSAKIATVLGHAADVAAPGPKITRPPGIAKLRLPAA